MTRRRSIADHAVLESRLGARLAGGLTLNAQALPHDVSERLRIAREQALGRACETRRAAATESTVVAAGRGVAVFGGFAPWWQRAASVLPLFVLVAGLVAIDRWAMREQVLAAAEIDALLLADNLPPAAYSDPGFAEYLRNAPTP